jgi:hypothetical protein
LPLKQKIPLTALINVDLTPIDFGLWGLRILQPWWGCSELSV